MIALSVLLQNVFQFVLLFHMNIQTAIRQGAVTVVSVTGTLLHISWLKYSSDAKKIVTRLAVNSRTVCRYVFYCSVPTASRPSSVPDHRGDTLLLQYKARSRLFDTETVDSPSLSLSAFLLHFVRFFSRLLVFTARQHSLLC